MILWSSCVWQKSSLINEHTLKDYVSFCYLRLFNFMTQQTASIKIRVERKYTGILSRISSIITHEKINVLCQFNRDPEISVTSRNETWTWCPYYRLRCDFVSTSERTSYDPLDTLRIMKKDQQIDDECLSDFPLVQLKSTSSDQYSSIRLNDTSCPRSWRDIDHNRHRSDKYVR